MLNQAKNIFLVGIKGVAMANLALILKKMGKNVTGSDVKEEFITEENLKKNHILVKIGFNPDNLPKNADLVVYSSGHLGQKNPQVKLANNLKIKTITQAELLSNLFNQFKTKIAVCGCHGKTTSSSLLSYALIKLGAKPSYMVGSSTFNDYPGGDYARHEYFVAEADEYGTNPPYDLTPKFHFLNPDFILCVNIDFDHPDVYKNLDQVKQAYLKFFANKKLILCADDPPTLQTIKRLKRGQFLTYGFSSRADLKISNPKNTTRGASFELAFKQKQLGVFNISLFGEKNTSNAAGVILTLLLLGFDPEKIKSAIKDFIGAKRRFELVYKNNDTYLFDDYAHHPKEIETTILAARSRFRSKRIVVIFQPHTYSRTLALLKGFGQSLSLADKAFILPIFASARENPQKFNISGENIANLNQKKLFFISSIKQLLLNLKSYILNRDVIITLGAGNVYKLKSDIIEIIAKL